MGIPAWLLTAWLLWSPLGNAVAGGEGMPSQAEPLTGIGEEDRRSGVIIRLVKTGGIAGIFHEGKIWADGRVATFASGPRTVGKESVTELMGLIRESKRFDGWRDPEASLLCRDCFHYSISALVDGRIRSFETVGLDLPRELASILERIEAMLSPR